MTKAAQDADPALHSSEEGRAARSERAAVWVVDDSLLQLEACRAALATDFEVTTFASGSAALEALGTTPPPAVIVLDLQMPDISGLDVCRFVRSQLALTQVAVLILTIWGSDEHLIEALAAGANDFVRKPVSDLEVRARVAGLVRMSSLHAELLEAQRKLVVEAEFRERFMGILAHDLRQPLNAMALACQTLNLAAGAPDVASSALAVHRRASQRMQRMIDELLDFTRTRPDAGMPIQRQATDLARVALVTVDEMRSAWPKRELDVHADEPCVGQWDPDRLAQICSNLIANALEHSSPTSRIQVNVQQVPGAAKLTVTNDGDGIPDDILPTLFQPFRRGPSVKSTSQGVGLGLYIVEQIARAHGGKVDASSRRGHTEFSVTLPIEP
jgi:two-component system, sensor histidine kinase and response regulator